MSRSSKKPSSNKPAPTLAGVVIALLVGAAIVYQAVYGTEGPFGSLVKQILSGLQVEEARETGVVKKAVDGDTIVVEMNGREYRVRYIGVDTPESTTKQECYGKEAARFNAKLVEGQTVRFERDVNETDRFGRLLRYVYLTNGEMVNEVLVREGYALARSFPPDVKYQDRLREAEREAKQRRRGLWRACPNPGD
ncbi:MAG: thermonuclease family protein [Anaerolineae bacterium]|nr:thermonuclease family protein [Anaerolineae bacterium]